MRRYQYFKTLFFRSRKYKTKTTVLKWSLLVCFCLIFSVPRYHCHRLGPRRMEGCTRGPHLGPALADKHHDGRVHPHPRNHPLLISLGWTSSIQNGEHWIKSLFFAFDSFKLQEAILEKKFSLKNKFGLNYFNLD